MPDTPPPIQRPHPMLPTPAQEPHPPSFVDAIGHGVLVAALGVITLVVLGMISVAVAALLAPALGALFVIGGVFMLIVAGASFSRFNFERSVSLLHYLYAAVRLNLPLAEYMEQVARGESGQIRRQSRSIADRLRNGYGLGETLMSVPTELSRSDAAVVWRGEACGRVGPALARLERKHARQRRDSAALVPPISALGYAAMVSAAILLLSTGVGVFILPKFEEIVADFDTQLPWFTIETFKWVAIIGPPVGLLAIAAVIWMVGWSLYSGVRGVRGMTDPVFRALEPLYWRVPVISGGHRSRALGDACFLIEQAMRAGEPLPDAIDNAANPAVSRVLEARLTRFAQQLRQGMPLADAARAAGLPGLVAGTLATAEQTSDPAEVFAYLGRYYDTKASPLEAALRSSLLPILTLILAIIVGWIVLSIFYPLIVIIEKTNSITGYY